MTLDQFKLQNAQSGQHFFDRDKMRSFRSRIVASSWNGDGYFITSEQVRADYPRLYSIRKANFETFGVDAVTFGVDEVSKFQEYKTGRQAAAALRKIRKSHEYRNWWIGEARKIQNGGE